MFSRRRLICGAAASLLLPRRESFAAPALIVPAQVGPSLPSQFVVPFGLIGYWGFDPDCLAGASALDLSGSNNTGTIIASSPSAQGQVGGALSFNGSSQWINLPNNLGTNFANGQMSAAAWTYAASASGNGYMMCNWGASAGAFIFGTNGTNYDVFVAQSSGTVIGGVVSTAAIVANTWTHVGMVADGSFLRLYVNGQPSGTPASYNGTLKTSFTYTNIAAKASDTNTSPGTWWVGRLDDIRLYNRGLAPWEMLQLYQVGLAGSRNAPVPLSLPPN